MRHAFRAPGLPLLIADPETTTIAALGRQIAALAGVPSRTFTLSARVLGFTVRAIGRRGRGGSVDATFRRSATTRHNGSRLEGSVHAVGGAFLDG